MKKNVFRFNEFKPLDDKVVLGLYKDFSPEEEVEEVPEVPEYTGPTADDLRREAEAFKKQWEIEKQQLLDNTEEESKKIIANAEEIANAEVAKKKEEAEALKQKAQEQADSLIAQAREQAALLVSEAESKVEQIKTDAQKEGFTAGHKEGYEDGNAEVSRLIERLHTVINKTLDRRLEILDETEQQIVNLVLLVSRKVVKVISEKQRDIVLHNINAALKKLKTRGDITIRVNMADLSLASEHLKDFIKNVEVQDRISFMEDSSVEAGGCVIETDFGSIDARISSQLAELEQRILDVSPMK
ncbi:MAG: flagellar assembly protein FliH [Treponemataceae bacterium]